MVLKACRGAGLALGVAEDMSEASGFMPVSALSILADILDEPPRHADLEDLCATLDGEVCGAPQSTHKVSAELMTAARIARGIETGAEITGPRDIAADLWARLDRLAQNTYVPASAGSRAAGAGAGLDDND